MVKIAFVSRDLHVFFRRRCWAASAIRIAKVVQTNRYHVRLLRLFVLKHMTTSLYIDERLHFHIMFPIVKPQVLNA